MLIGRIRGGSSIKVRARTTQLVEPLDEPTNDVDPVRRRLLWDQLAVVSLWCLPAIACSQLALNRRR